MIASSRRRGGPPAAPSAVALLGRPSGHEEVRPECLLAKPGSCPNACGRTDEWAVECGVSAAPLRGRAGRRPWGSDQPRTEPEDLLRKRRPRQVARSCLGRDRRLCAHSEPGAATWDLAYTHVVLQVPPGLRTHETWPWAPRQAILGLPWPLRELGSQWGWGLALPTTSGWPSLPPTAAKPQTFLSPVLAVAPALPSLPAHWAWPEASVSQEDFVGPQG